MKAVILAGGTGSRLWPLSRKSKPKQFQKLTSNQTMLQETIGRLNFLKPEDIYIAINKEYLTIVKEQTKKFKIPVKNIIIEPSMQDTAPCIGLAAMYIAKHHPTEVMSVIYADHLIADKKEFARKLKIAEQLAREEKTLNIIEVKAKFPNVNLGYVKIGKPLREIKGTEIYAFRGFTEKPSLAVAKKFLQSFKYLWNTGLYVWRTDTILEAYKKFLPKTYKNLLTIKKNIGTPRESAVLAENYPKCEKISIDYGIMEKVNPALVRIIPADLGWSDVGTWEGVFAELPRDRHNNLIKGKHIGIDSTGSLIYGDGRKLIATIGIKDLIVVDTGDTLLVCRKDKSQDVKKLVDKIKNSEFKNLL
ncbi:NTP transferase domain-containing protein [Patescibacteria group bacterium]|nr:NTP transferase domain-containing protein [Patescibacteria group bacterium]MBU1703545.1 NTP transferase domain-containing protein [Patescibacteria group bacterium]MBU1953879.1 NTP transferase domain-containing protein [Patescibacteria group bacterium]